MWSDEKEKSQIFLFVSKFRYGNDERVNLGSFISSELIRNDIIWLPERRQKEVMNNKTSRQQFYFLTFISGEWKGKKINDNISVMADTPIIW